MKLAYTIDSKVTVKPLMLAYYLFLLLVAGTVLYAKSFSYLHISCCGVPIYVTEAFLILSFTLMALLVFHRKSVVIDVSEVLYVCVFVLWSYAFVNGMVSYPDKVFVARHSALIYYAAFYFITPMLVRTVQQLKILFVVFIAATVISVLSDMMNVGMGIGGFSYYYSAIAFVIIIVVLHEMSFKMKLLMVPIGGLLAIGAGVSMVRASWVGLIGAISFMILISLLIADVRRVGLKVIRLMIVLFLTGFVMVSVFKPTLIANVWDEALTIVVEVQVMPFHFAYFK